jgi:DNA-binding transcriptional regulator YhcF (GntR family)
MMLHIDTSLATPPYEQVRSQIEELIQSGALPAGVRLPTIRQLANDLGVAPGTIARCYRQLEEAGLVITRGRRGSFVAQIVSDATVQRRLSRLTLAAQSYAREARRLKISHETAARAIRNALTAEGL